MKMIPILLILSVALVGIAWSNDRGTYIIMPSMTVGGNGSSSIGYQSSAAGWTNTTSYTMTNLSVLVGTNNTRAALTITNNNVSGTGLSVRAGAINPAIIDPASVPNLFTRFNSSGLSSVTNGSYAPFWTASAGEPIQLRTYSGVYVKNDSSLPYPYVGTIGFNQGKMDNLTLTHNWTQPSTVFIVTRQRGAGSWIMNFNAGSFDGSPGILQNYYGPGQYLGLAGATGTYKSGGTYNVWQVITVVFNTTGSRTCVRGSCGALENYGNLNFSSLQLFMWTGASNSDIAEFIIYNSTMSEDNRQGIESYLANKYNILLDSGSQQTGDLFLVEDAVGNDKYVINKNGKVTQYANSLTDTLWETSTLGESFPHFAFSGQKFMLGDGTQNLSDGNTGNHNWDISSWTTGDLVFESAGNNPAGKILIRSPGSGSFYFDIPYATFHTPYMSVNTYDQTPEAAIDVQIANPAAKGVIVQGASAQSANLQEWENSGGTILASVGSSGDVNITRDLSVSGLSFVTMPHGHLRFSNESGQVTSIASSGVWVNVTNGWAINDSRQTTLGMNNNTATGELTVLYSGDYDCYHSESWSGTPLKEYNFGLAVNNSIIMGSEGDYKADATGDEVSTGGRAYIPLGTGATVRVQVINRDSANDVAIAHMSMGCTRIGVVS